MVQKPRKKTVIGKIDSDSDEEVEIDISAALNVQTGAATLSRTRYVSDVSPSRNHIPPPAIVPPTVTPEIPSEPSSSLGEKTTPKQGASILLEPFIQELSEIQHCILETETHKDIKALCTCGSNLERLYRCYECFNSHMFCLSCVLSAHVHSPFHIIMKWSETYFIKTSLKELGATIPLGHCGLRCPNRSATSLGRPTTVVHTNGMHKAIIEYCCCLNASLEPFQLLKANLFPSTMDQPSTVFTFEVLRNFEKHNLASKKSAYDYCDALRKLTDGAFPQTTPERYDEFNRASRVWQHLAVERRSGQALDIGQVLIRPGTKSLALRCPACPDIGFNVDKVTVDSANESEAHKYTLFLSTDGNFRLQRKNKRDDPDDHALNNGRAYFVEEQQYISYLDAVDQADDRSTCAHLRAVRLQNIIKFLNAIKSGVVAIQCARHGFYWTVVDLAKGECFARTDYALAQALSNSEAENQRWIMLSYDIWCQYSKKLKARFKKHFPEIAPVLERLRGAVPKMHIKGHVLYCQLLWSFNYLPFSGETCGESIEGSWAEHNQTAGSTKEMNEGHRHDTLDAFFGYWNWTKSHEMGKTLYRLYMNCLALLKKRQDKFNSLSKRFAPELVAKWTAMDITPIIQGDQVVSVYEAQIGKNGPPTQGRQYEKLLREESINQLAGVDSGVGDAHFINTGLRLERDQISIQKMVFAAKGADTDAILKARAKLQHDILKWRTTQIALCPLLRQEIKAGNPLRPEQDILLLPSHLSQPLRSSLGLEKHARFEYTLREGQAHDALESVRKAIRTFNFNLNFKKEQVRGQGANTRAQNFLRTLTAEKISCAEKYRVSRKALLSLGLQQNDPVFRELLDSELWSKNSAAPLRLGDSHLDDPWFWTVGRPSGLSDEDGNNWNLEMDRVKWFRDRAAWQRSQEEKEILEEEFKRTIRSFERLQEVWTELGKREEFKSGKANYAFQHAGMYRQLASDCNAFFTKALTKN